MPRLPVEQEILPAVGRRQVSPQHRRRRAIGRAVVSVIILSLTAWVAGAALAPSTGPIARVLLLVIAVLLPLHLVFWQLNGMRVLDRMKGWPRPTRASVAMVGLAASPMTLYPLGLLAVVVALFSGGVATPALAVTGVLMLSPILAIVVLGLMFTVSRHR
jgi:hypothetical protein